MTIAQEKTIIIGLAEIQASSDPEATLTCLGLGSCVGLCMFDPQSKVAGMVHIVLPESNGKTNELSPKYADTAVPLLLQEMTDLGAIKSRLVVKMAGGAQMSISDGAGSLFKTGEKNIEATQEALAKAGIRLAASDVGGYKGRTLRLYASSGKVTVSSVGAGVTEL